MGQDYQENCQKCKVTRGHRLSSPLLQLICTLPTLLDRCRLIISHVQSDQKQISIKELQAQVLAEVMNQQAEDKGAGGKRALKKIFKEKVRHER